MKVGITNLKGGVGKTTLSVNIAVTLTHMKYSVCIVDTDNYNKNSLQWFGARDEALPKIMVFGNNEPKALNKAVEQLNKEYDVVIMDGTPTLSEMTTRIILASDLLLIPTRPGAHDVRAMQQFVERINQVREMKEDIAAYFLMNEYNERYTLHSSVYESLKENFPEIPILKTSLKSRSAYGEANVNGTGVFETPDAKAKEELVSLTHEILKLAKKHSIIKK